MRGSGFSERAITRKERWTLSSPLCSAVIRNSPGPTSSRARCNGTALSISSPLYCPRIGSASAQRQPGGAHVGAVGVQCLQQDASEVGIALHTVVDGRRAPADQPVDLEELPVALL